MTLTRMFLIGSLQTAAQRSKAVKSPSFSRFSVSFFRTSLESDQPELSSVSWHILSSNNRTRQGCTVDLCVHPGVTGQAGCRVLLFLHLQPFSETATSTGRLYGQETCGLAFPLLFPAGGVDRPLNLTRGHDGCVRATKLSPKA
jgi:hypothetical protein